jgi:hypothetical protein
VDISSKILSALDAILAPPNSPDELSPVPDIKARERASKRKGRAFYAWVRWRFSAGAELRRRINNLAGSETQGGSDWKIIPPNFQKNERLPLRLNNLGFKKPEK